MKEIINESRPELQRSPYSLEHLLPFPFDAYRGLEMLILNFATGLLRKWARTKTRESTYIQVAVSVTGRGIIRLA